jgi:hypothetical protein
MTRLSYGLLTAVTLTVPSNAAVLALAYGQNNQATIALSSQVFKGSWHVTLSA